MSDGGAQMQTILANDLTVQALNSKGVIGRRRFE